MKALCLQGGGAKGAYQAGALKALQERGCHFDCAIGASVGAINAAMYASGRVDELYKIWENLDYADLFPEESRLLSESAGGLSFFLTVLRLFGNGIDTTRLRALLTKTFDEDALRASPVRFGLVTVKVGEQKELEKLFIEDIPKGRLVDYLMASAAIPFFTKVEIDGVQYLDGGIMDNLPIGMLVEAGYSDITAIRLGGDIRYDNGDTPLSIEYFDPSEGIGHTMSFTKESIKHSLLLGYYDTLRTLDGLVGKRFYVKPFTAQELRHVLKKHASSLEKWLRVLGEKVVGFDEQVDRLLKKIGAILGESGSETEIWTAFAERIATALDLFRWKVYTWEEMFSEMAKQCDLGENEQEDAAEKPLFAFARMLFEEWKK